MGIRPKPRNTALQKRRSTKSASAFAGGICHDPLTLARRPHHGLPPSPGAIYCLLRHRRGERGEKNESEAKGAAPVITSRMHCKAMGCDSGTGPYCLRCHTDLYDAEFVEYGWLDPLFRAYWATHHWLRKLGPKKCAQCGKKFTRGVD